MLLCVLHVDAILIVSKTLILARDHLKHLSLVVAEQQSSVALEADQASLPL